MSEKTVVNLAATVNLSCSAETAKISIRQYLSMAHIAGARSSAIRAKELEDSQDVRAVIEHKGCVSGCIISCVAFLEASINEFFSDCAEAPDELKLLSDESIRWVGRYWTLGTPRMAAYQILEKFEFALKVFDKGTLDKSRKPTQDIVGLIKLRNALVHYEPEWRSDDDDPSKLEKLLRNRFEPNRLTSVGNPFWPAQCLGYGCCKWATSAALAFTREFWNQLGLSNRHSHFYSTFNPLP
jgi:hypothetical protein